MVLLMQQMLAATVLWLRTKWIYEREAKHLREVGQDIMEENSPGGFMGSSYLQGPRDCALCLAVGPAG
jgi:hypothetical protein